MLDLKADAAIARAYAETPYCGYNLGELLVRFADMADRLADTEGLAKVVGSFDDHGGSFIGCETERLLVQAVQNYVRGE